MHGSLLLIDKPCGITSFDIIRRLRPSYSGIKIGHAGTLDPFASGMMLILLGKGTKFSDALMGMEKSYQAVVHLGEARDSLDITGELTQTLPVPELSESQVRETLQGYVGEWMQTPPMFSAKKIHGVRFYSLAREGIYVRRQASPVHLYSMDFDSWKTPYLAFSVKCSKGTYVRSLAEDIGKKLGTVGYLHSLRRTSCGPFSMEEALTLEQVLHDPVQALVEGQERLRNYIGSQKYHQKSQGVTQRFSLPPAMFDVLSQVENRQEINER